MFTRSVTCPCCGGRYTVFAFYVGDQHLCAACRAEEIRREIAPTPAEQREQAARRAAYFRNRR